MTICSLVHRLTARTVKWTLCRRVCYAVCSQRSVVVFKLHISQAGWGWKLRCWNWKCLEFRSTLDLDSWDMVDLYVLSVHSTDRIWLTYVYCVHSTCRQHMADLCLVYTLQNSIQLIHVLNVHCRQHSSGWPIQGIMYTPGWPAVCHLPILLCS